MTSLLGLSLPFWTMNSSLTGLIFLSLQSVSHSVSQFSRSVVSDSLQPHELQHARPPCPPPTPRVHSNSCPLSPWCHPAISSSVIPFSSCPQSFPASGSFQLSQLFASGGQSVGVSASASLLPMNTQDWSPLGWTGWVCAKLLQSCPTLCNPMNHSLPGSSVHGDSPGKNTGVGCHAFLQGIFLTRGSNLHLLSPALAGSFFTTSATWEDS